MRPYRARSHTSHSSASRWSFSVADDSLPRVRLRRVSPHPDVNSHQFCHRTRTSPGPEHPHHPRTTPSTASLATPPARPRRRSRPSGRTRRFRKRSETSSGPTSTTVEVRHRPCAGKTAAAARAAIYRRHSHRVITQTRAERAGPTATKSWLSVGVSARVRHGWTGRTRRCRTRRRTTGRTRGATPDFPRCSPSFSACRSPGSRRTAKGSRRRRRSFNFVLSGRRGRVGEQWGGPSLAVAIAYRHYSPLSFTYY